MSPGAGQLALASTITHRACLDAGYKRYFEGATHMRCEMQTKQGSHLGERGHAIIQGWMKRFVLLTFLAFASAALGQLTTADILGTVTDSTSAVVPNANVTLINLGTNEKRTTLSNGSGDYNFTLLPVGHYSIEVKATGFAASITKDLSVEAGDRARNDVQLQLGSESTVVEVTASTPLLQAESATVSSTVTAKAVQDLPLNGRNFVQLVQLVPGANEGPGNGLSSGGRPDDRRTNAAGLSVNGQDDTLNNWVIDGVDDNERVIGTIGVKPNVEGIQEITVQTNSYAAEAGRTAGGVINIVTRSGTNQFHGSVLTLGTSSRRPDPSLNCARISTAAALADRSGGTVPSSTLTMKDSGRSQVSHTRAPYRPCRSGTTSTVKTADPPWHCFRRSTVHFRPTMRGLPSIRSC
jgi:hypothetical protein